MKEVHEILTDISQNPRASEHDKKQMKVLARLDKVERKTYENKYRSGRNPIEHVMSNSHLNFQNADVDNKAMDSHISKTICLVKSNNFSDRVCLDDTMS